MSAVRLRFAVLLGVASVVVAACFPTPVTHQARQIDALYRLFLAGGVLVAAIVWGLATWALLRYRRRDGRLPEQIRGSRRLEVLWTATPLAAVLILFGFTYATLDSVNAIAPGSGVQIHVNAFRWQWQFDYGAEGVSLMGLPGNPPEMVVPIGEPVHVTLTASDVNHAFSVPSFLFKRDAIPGRTTRFDFQVEVPGVYQGYCAEFCGVQHDRMLFTVRGVTRPDYDAWLATQRAGAGASPGASP